MGLLSRFKRQTGAASQVRAAEEPAGDAVQIARTRARRRLIGASVLLLVGIIGFPIVFETQPRPIPLDIPIEIPRKDAAPPLVMPAARPDATPSRSAHGNATEEIITEGREAAAANPPDAKSAASAEAARKAAAEPAKAEAKTEPAKAETAKAETRKEPAKLEPSKAEAKIEPKAEPKPPAAEPARAAESAKKPAADLAKKAPDAEGKTTDAARARTLLEGNAHAAAESGRFVVQVGAFADAAAAREVRQRVEKLGLKTYTQVAQTASGSRIRVRVGPFSSRDEAERALGKARGAGLQAVVLTL